MHVVFAGKDKPPHLLPRYLNDRSLRQDSNLHVWASGK